MLCIHVVNYFCSTVVCIYFQVGGGSSGKKSIVLSLAQLTGHKLVEFPMNSDTDTTELLGGFQQVCVWWT